MNKDLIIGCHVSMNAPDYYLGSVKEALSYGANTFMFYTGAPQNSYRKPLEELKIDEGRQLIKEAGINEDNIVVHAPYIVNLANMNDLEKHEASKRIIANELIRCEAFNVHVLVLHPGAHMNKGEDFALNAIAKALDDIFSRLPQDNHVKIALETMSGKGSEVGINFEQISKLISLSNFKDRLGVCLDTCHVNDAGYNVFDKEQLFEQFDKIIGLDKLLVVHVNDSKNPIGAHKDRHENIGYGEIGFDALNSIVNDERLKNIPKILETPYFNQLPPYKKEIEMFRNGKFVPNWRDNI